jgi:dynein heavy chain
MASDAPGRRTTQRVFKDLGVKMPHIPPIQRPDPDMRDRYSNSWLLKYRRRKENDNKMKELLINKANESYKETQAAYREEVRQHKEAPPADPNDLISEEKMIRDNYLLMRSFVEKSPIAPMQTELLDVILTLVPARLKCVDLSVNINSLITEIGDNFTASMRKSMVQYALVRPNVPGLDEDDNIPRPESPTGLDYSSPWRASYMTNREMIKDSLHMLNPVMSTTLALGHTSLSRLLLINCANYRSLGALEFEALRSMVILECERNEQKLQSSWWQSVVALFTDKKKLTMRRQKLSSFYNNISTVMSNQLKDVLTRTIQAGRDCLRRITGL